MVVEVVLAREDPVLGSEVFVLAIGTRLSCCCDEFSDAAAEEERECVAPREAEFFRDDDDEPTESRDCTIADFER